MNTAELLIGFFITLTLGVMCILFGFMNRKGNFSMLHSYHYKRVSAADRLPFGKLVGTGMLVIGVSFIVLSAMMLISELMSSEVLALVGTVVSCCGLAVGLGINFYAMFKYNKGIF